jgi:1,4-alpha-glucan branching enzyme
MHDTLQYLQRDPIYRRYHQNQLTFRSLYQFSENYVMPLSHDEVVHGKGSLLNKMAGDPWQKFANLRLLLTNQWMQPGKKLLFMGGEFGQWREWNHDQSLDWHLLDEGEHHQALQRLVERLNRLYKELPALHELDCDPAGFAWVDANDADNCVLSYTRMTQDRKDVVLVVFNNTPLVRHNYILGVPHGCPWREQLNTDALEYGGSGVGNLGRVEANPVPMHGQDWSLTLTLPPLAALVLTPDFSEEGAQS